MTTTMFAGSSEVSRFFAHSADGGTDNWEPLAVHLAEVSQLAGEFAGTFNAARWGQLAGLWHDLGKYSSEFQNYLLTANGLKAHIEQRSKVDHSTAGAKHAESSIPEKGRLLAYIIAGHHAGLADAFEGPSSISQRLKKEIPDYSSAPQKLLSPGISLANPPITLDVANRNNVAFQLSVFTRMLFSCLVDADFLATERFMSPTRAEQRPSVSSPFEAMRDILKRTLDVKTAEAENGPVKDSRQKVLQECRDKALRSPGMFSLTVPTGGGKTLSSLSFAIEHLLHYEKRRIIYAIPFTSIIEQTASVFRDVFQPLQSEGIGDVVLEHHSSVDPDDEHETPQSRLAAENWDAPLVVTTNVQLLESVFACKTSRCRKLHNIVNSVIILDEAQTLQVKLLRPCLRMLNELVTNYGCTIVLCTATQPAISLRDEFPIGLSDVREIVSEPEKLFATMKRVSVCQLGPLSNEELLERMEEHPSFLAIVNTKRHAATLYRELKSRQPDDDGLFHLSTFLCGQHRANVIAEIRTRLESTRPCRVISTQLIEAGVDVDFPVVFRSLSGVDSVAQAAGRCNREGRLSSGTVFVFEPTEYRSPGYLGQTADVAADIASQFDDLLSPDAIEEYFRMHYWKQEGENKWDRSSDDGVMDCFKFGRNPILNFRTAAERFRLIDQEGTAIFVPYQDKGRALIEQLRVQGPSRQLLRQLQRYTVTLSENQLREVAANIEVLHESYCVLIDESQYDAQLGLRLDYLDEQNTWFA